MTSGAVIFAFNNQKIDYVRLAEWNARNIERNLDLPTTLITDVPYQSTIFDQVIVVPRPAGGTRYFDDVKDTVDWYNGNRVDALQLSPYDQTLVLDADYVVGGTELVTWLESSQDFLCYRRAYDVTGRTSMEDLETFGSHRFPMYWATVMMFRRTTQTEFLFDHMRMIRDNWQHYRNLYKIAQTNFRNDHALSIALGLLSGHSMKISHYSGSMATVMPDVQITRAARKNSYVLDFTRGEKESWLHIADMDFHAMGKKHLGDLIETGD